VAASTRVVARSLEQAEAVRPVWETIPFERVDADVDFFSTVVRARPEVVRPHVIVRDDGAGGVVVARVEDIALTVSFGYRSIARPRVRALTVVPGGVAGVASQRVAQQLTDDLRAVLAEGEADVLVVPGVRTESALFTALESAPFACRGHAVERTTHRRLSLPPTFDELLASRSRSTRESVKRYTKRLLREHEDDLVLEVFRTPAEAERLFRDLETVAATTYQRGLGVAFADNEEHRSLALLGLDRGWFRAYVLSLAGRPIAFWTGYAYNGVFSIGTPGYDPAFAEHRVGQYVQMRMLEDLCDDPEVDSVDYGFGDAEYKRRFSDESWEEADLVLFAPRLRPVLLNALRSGGTGAALLAKRVLGQERAAEVKKRWRGRLERDR
jgi:CelD/BcsL family acetyltransferase involved in cellulose biosynthesis